MAEAGFELRTSVCIFYEINANPCVSRPAHFLSVIGTAEEMISLTFILVLLFGLDSQWGNLDAPQPSRGPGAPPGIFIPWAGVWGPSGWSLPLCPLNTQSAFSRPLPGPSEPEPGLHLSAFPSFLSAESWAPHGNFQDPLLGVLWPSL